jgi:hypothetical protein
MKILIVQIGYFYRYGFLLILCFSFIVVLMMVRITVFNNFVF